MNYLDALRPVILHTLIIIFAFEFINFDRVKYKATCLAMYRS